MPHVKGIKHANKNKAEEDGDDDETDPVGGEDDPNT